MNKKPIPDYLYHYTSLSSLVLILKSREIRLNSLINMDDLEEAKAHDLKEYGKYCFISSWTDGEDEKISLWNMYTHDMAGVRIKLHTLPFETYNYQIKRFGKDIKLKDTFLPKHFFDESNPIPSSYRNEDFLIRVEYTDDEKLIYPELLEYDSDNNQTKLKLPLLGKYKRKEWCFQDEVRYKISFFPFYDEDINNFDKMKQNIINQKDLLSYNCYLKIKEEYFNKIEITKGPKMSAGDEEILNLIVDKYCNTAKIMESKFKGKIR